MERAPRCPRRQPRQVRQRARTRALRGRSAGSPRGEERAGRAARDSKAVATTSRSRSRRLVAVLVKKSQIQWRGVERTSRWPKRQPRQVTKSASARVPRGQSAGSPRGEARAGRAARDSEAMVMSSRSRSRRPGAVSVQKRLGQRRGVKCAPRWPRRKPRQKAKSASACVLRGR